VGDIITALSESSPKIQFPKTLIKLMPLKFPYEVRIGCRQPRANLAQHCPRWPPPWPFYQFDKIWVHLIGPRAWNRRQEVNGRIGLIALNAEFGQIGHSAYFRDFET
jgi:hypothetical protein